MAECRPPSAAAQDLPAHLLRQLHCLQPNKRHKPYFRDFSIYGAGTNVPFRSTARCQPCLLHIRPACKHQEPVMHLLAGRRFPQQVGHLYRWQTYCTFAQPMALQAYWQHHQLTTLHKTSMFASLAVSIVMVGQIQCSRVMLDQAHHAAHRQSTKRAKHCRDAPVITEPCILFGVCERAHAGTRVMKYYSCS